MNIFYMTFGKCEKGYPFSYNGGYIKIHAASREEAVEKFKSYDKYGNYAGIYSEQEWFATDMSVNGNFGFGCYTEIA